MKNQIQEIKLGKLLKPDLCENCSKRPKHYDVSGRQRKWCRVCINKYYRERWENEKLENAIISITDPLFVEARIEHLPIKLQVQQENRCRRYVLCGCAKKSAIAVAFHHQISVFAYTWQRYGLK